MNTNVFDNNINGIPIIINTTALVNDDAGIVSKCIRILGLENIANDEVVITIPPIFINIQNEPSKNIFVVSGEYFEYIKEVPPMDRNIPIPIKMKNEIYDLKPTKKYNPKCLKFATIFSIRFLDLNFTNYQSIK